MYYYLRQSIVCLKQTIPLQIFQRLSSISFSWSILEYCVTFDIIRACRNTSSVNAAVAGQGRSISQLTFVKNIFYEICELCEVKKIVLFKEYVSEDFVNLRVKFCFYNYIPNKLEKAFHYKELSHMRLTSLGDTTQSSAKTFALVQGFFDGAFLWYRRHFYSNL